MGSLLQLLRLHLPLQFDFKWLILSAYLLTPHALHSLRVDNSTLNKKLLFQKRISFIAVNSEFENGAYGILPPSLRGLSCIQLLIFQGFCISLKAYRFRIFRTRLSLIRFIFLS